MPQVQEAMSNLASSLIEQFGGHKSLAEALGVDETRVFRWTYPKGRAGGTGGAIPPRHWPKLLELAKAKDIELTADDLVRASAVAQEALPPEPEAQTA